jgi:predicted PurR-regulated permease PerM
LAGADQPFLAFLGSASCHNVISFFAEAVIAFFTLFFLFREGGSMLARVAALPPLKAGQVVYLRASATRLSPMFTAAWRWAQPKELY